MIGAEAMIRLDVRRSYSRLLAQEGRTASRPGLIQINQGRTANG
jgi:hypothetical protein